MHNNLLTALNDSSNALQANRQGALTAGNNVLNVNTPGYHHQYLTVVDATVTTGIQGVRDTSYYLEQNLRTQQSVNQFVTLRLDGLQQVDQLLGSMEEESIAGYLANLFASFENLAVSPNDLGVRQDVLGKATMLANYVQSSAYTLNQIQQNINNQIPIMLETINAQTSAIAALNEQILSATNADQQDVAFALMDERDSILSNLSQNIGVELILDTYGNYTVMVGNGLTLAAPSTSEPLSAVLNSSTGFYDVYMESTTQGEINARINSSGVLGALLTLRDGDILTQIDSLDQLAYDIATFINAQHAAGYGLDGITDRNLFVPPTAVSGAAITMAVNSSLQASQLAAAATTSLGDGTNALALNNLQYSKVVGGDTETLGQEAAMILAALGANLQYANQQFDASNLALNTAQVLAEKQIGVNVDESILTMHSYQEAYNASLRVIQTIEAMIKSLLEI